MCFCCFTNLHCFTLTLPKVVLLNVGINNIAICLCERRRPTAFKNLAPCKHSKSSLTGFVFVNISQFFLIEKHFIILFMYVQILIIVTNLMMIMMIIIRFNTFFFFAVINASNLRPRIRSIPF